MPWPPDQARAIAISYKRRGRKPPPEVERALSSSLKGVPAPKHHKKHRGPPKRLVQAQSARRRR